jgi:hypothetical protein
VFTEVEQVAAQGALGLPGDLAEVLEGLPLVQDDEDEGL